MIYILGSALFITVFIVERFTGVVSRIISKVVARCTRRIMFFEEHSSNLLKDLSLEDLQLEYS